MKSAERHRLKENDLAQLAAGARDALGSRRNLIAGIALALLLVVVGIMGYSAWGSRAESRAGGLLAEALAIEDARVGPPAAPGTPETGLTFPTERERRQATVDKLKAVVEQHPSTEAGMFARYRLAAGLMALGNTSEAAVQYQEVVNRAGDRIYGQMARLGLAETQAQSGQYDTAIATYQQLSQRTDGELPIDGVLMQLARTYLQAGKTAEAQQTFNRIVEEFPSSPYTSEARRELDGLKKT